MDPIMANESQPLWVKPPSLEVNLVGREPSKNWDFHGLGMKVYGQVATLRAWISSSAYKKSRDHLKVSHTISSPTAPRIGDPDEHHISPQSSCHFFFFWGFYGYADEPDVKRMLWSLGEKLWSLFWWRGCCHNEFQMPLVPSTQQVADPTILTSIFCVLQFLPEVFRHETLWSFQHALRDSSSIGGVSSLVTSCNRKVTSMYDQFFFQVHHSPP